MVKQSRLHIAICGGGPGGLVLAVVIGKLCADVKIDLYEAGPAFTEVGAGLSIWKRSWDVFQELGLGMALKALAIKPPEEGMDESGFILRKSDQAEHGFDSYTMRQPYDVITLHRADMLKLLTDNLPPSENFEAHFNKRMVSYTQVEDGVILNFADGSSAEADTLVGADGVKSVARRQMYEGLAQRTNDSSLKKHVNATWSGTFAYRCLIDVEALLEKVPNHPAVTETAALRVWAGKDKHIVSFPISQGRFINIVASVAVPGGEGTELKVPARVDDVKQEMLRQYAGFEPYVVTMLECAGKTSRWATSHVRHLPTYVDGRVSLLGDSAHAMTTHLGAGAGQAIEDAFILGRLLSNPLATRSNLTTVLSAYDAVRRPVGTRFVETSRACGYTIEFNGHMAGIDGLDEAKLRKSDKDELKKLGEAVYEFGTITKRGSILEEWEVAEKMLGKFRNRDEPEEALFEDTKVEKESCE